MNSGLNPADPTLVAAFRSALLHQGAIALIFIAFLWLAWATARTWRLTTPGPRQEAGNRTARSAARGRRSGGSGETRDRRPPHAGIPEAAGRRLLRVGLGLLWILDGLLQAQPKMAGGLATHVIEPTAAASPAWVQHVVNWGGTIWSYHPITASAASVWIQVGIGAWLIVARRGWWSRLAGLASMAWGLVVWVFGESFGGIFAPGLSWLAGAPGAVLIYVVAGALIALPNGAWRSARLGRLLLGGIGIFLIGMAVLQAWPGRGYWQGTIHGQPGTLAGMVQTMSSTPQPHFLSALLARFGSFAASNGLVVNLVVVIALTAMGVIFLTGKPWLVRYAVWFGIAFGLADWVLVQDLGFLGGLGTDPNSMIPLILLYSAGYLALTPAPPGAPDTQAAKVDAGAHVAEGERDAGSGDEAGRGGGPGRRLGPLAPAAVGGMLGTASARSVAAVAALAVIVIGAAPMAAAAANRTADPILAQAIAGTSTALDIPAPGFALTDQNGRGVSLASLRGKVVLMMFLDPVCTTDCPIIGQELKQAGVLLGPADQNVELIAVVANPAYRAVAFTRAFDRQEGLDAVPNWRYLTGSASQLGQVWARYGSPCRTCPRARWPRTTTWPWSSTGPGTSARRSVPTPGPGTASTQSSFSVLLAQYARQALAGS
jgi:cytochrome oxidase Cu insertion factor (SCO1/SenC/PrrC family)